MTPRLLRSFWAKLFVLLLVSGGALVVRHGRDLTTTHYYVRAVPYRVMVAAGPRAGAPADELLMLVGSSTWGWRGTKLEAALVPVGEWLGFVQDTPEAMRSRLELIRVRPGTTPAERRDLSELPSYGIPVAADGAFYYLAPAYDDEYDDEEDVTEQDVPADAARGWRWDGAEFVAITPEEAMRLYRQEVHARRARRAQTGDRAEWTICQLAPFGGAEETNSCDLPYAGGRWQIKVKPLQLSPEKIDLPNMEVALSLRLVNQQARETRTLIDDAGVWQEVSGVRFAALTEPRMGALGGRYFGRHFTPGAGLMNLFWATLLLCVPCYLMRQAINRSVSPVSHYPEARPEHFPLLDQERLARLTHELTALGFVHLRDYTVAYSGGAVQRVASFARLFAHPEHNCYAEIGQLFIDPQKQAQVREYLGMRLSFTSLFAEPGWTLSITDREPASIPYQLRRPRRLFLYRPGLLPDQLLGAHLEVRSEMMRRLDLRPASATSAEEYLARQAEAVEEMRQTLRQRTRLVLPFLFEHTLLKTRKHYHWLGDYGLHPAPRGWTPPVAVAHDEERFARTGFSCAPAPGGVWGLLRNWTELIGLTSSTLLLVNAYFWWFHPPHQQSVRLFHTAVAFVGLGGQLLTWLLKKKSTPLK